MLKFDKSCSIVLARQMSPLLWLMLRKLTFPQSYVTYLLF